MVAYHNQSTHHSEESSNASAPSTSGQIDPRDSRHGQRQHYKSKFSSIVDEEHDVSGESKLEMKKQENISEIRLSESEDVAGQHIPANTMAKSTVALSGLPASNWAERIDAVASQAQSNTSRLHQKLSKFRSHRSPKSDRQMPQSTADASPPTKPTSDWLIKLEGIPLDSHIKDKRPYTIHEDTTNDDGGGEQAARTPKGDSDNVEQARKLMKTMTSLHPTTRRPRSGTETPAVDKHLHDLDYIPPPKEYRPSPFTLATKLTAKLEALQRTGYTGPNYRDDHGVPSKGHHSQSHSRNGSESQEYSATSSGRLTPSKRPKWYDDADSGRHQPSGSLGALLAKSTVTSAATGAPTASNQVPRPAYHRAKSSQSMIATAVDMIKHPTDYFQHKSQNCISVDEERAIHNLAEIIACRNYLQKLARSLMAVGAPSHRLEEYMKTSARALNIDGDFLYMPGSMVVSLHDRVTMSTEVTLVRESGGVDLGKFKDVFDVYKLVIHGKYTPEQGNSDLEEITKKRGRHPLALRIFAFGIAAISVGPFAFSARPVDFAPNFVLGSTLGFLQLIIAPRSEQFAHVFEVLAAVLIAFVSRGLGSIYSKGAPVFCFSAIAQSIIALILPGYIVLCAALELQSRSLVSGSVRMVYAIIYSLFLGFGILVGSVVMGLIYPQAQSDVTCHTPKYWNDSNHGPKLIYVRFVWVPIFAVCLAIINQAKWKQMPIMTSIAFVGYQSNFWVSTKLANNIQVANAIGAFAIGTMANLYSRFFHGLAAAAMLPGIFVMVPSGLAASGSLVAGITSAEQITGNATGVSVISNGTAGFLDAQNPTTTTDVYGGTIFNVGYGMVQVAIGISVGLYLSALVVYPFGKKKSGIFSL